MAPPMNTRQAAVIDPILSNHARGYRNAGLVADRLFPRVQIPNRSATVLKFGKESFRKLNTRRAPGTNIKRVQYGYASDPISLVQDSLEATVPVEHQEEARVPGIDLGTSALNMVLDVMELNLEIEAATLARTPGSYGSNTDALTGANRWTWKDSTPAQDVAAAKDVIRRKIGRRPNVLLAGPSAIAALKTHPAIIERFKYTTASTLTLAMLAEYFELDEVIAGDAVYLPETAADSAAATDVWGDDAILAWVPRGGSNWMVPSYGYTYELAGYPQVEAPYYARETRSWIYPVTVERRPYLVGADAGFLFQNAGGAHGQT